MADSEKTWKIFNQSLRKRERINATAEEITA